MRKIFITLGITFGSFLYAAIWTTIFYLNFNYRERYDLVFAFLFIVLSICNYVFGVYVIANIFLLYSKREREIFPSVLVSSSAISWVLSPIFIFLSSGILPIIFNSQYNNHIDIILLSILLFFQLVGIYIGCQFKNNRYISRAFIFREISHALLINLILLAVFSYNGFPGVNAPIEMRQKWAYQRFPPYPAMVCSIKTSGEIIGKVGNIKFIAPTKGKNIYSTSDGSMAASEFTLEVVGEKGTGIAYIETWGSIVTGISFEHKGKKTAVKGWGGGCKD